MPILREEIDIARSPEDVFAFLADFANDAKWRANVVEMKPLGTESDAFGVWSRQVEVRRVPGRIVESEAVITARERGRRLAVKRASGPIRPEARYTLAPSESGTRLTFELEIPLSGVTWLALPAVWTFMTLAIRPVVPRDLAKLKALLES